MRLLSLCAALLVMMNMPAAFAHCSKPHPDGKDKGSASRPVPKPE